MSRILIIENTNVLLLRIANIFSRKDIVVENINYRKNSIQNRINDANHLIVDTDNFEGNLKPLLTEIRQGLINKDIPITLMSSKPDETMVFMAAHFGGIEILVKPFSDIDFLKKVLRSKKSPLLKDIVTEKNLENNFKLKWCDEYKIGVELIDNEHKEIVDNFEQLYKRINEGNGLQHYADMLRFIEKYVSFHFYHEEEFQKKIGYQEIESHMAEHRNFKMQVEQLIQKQKDDTITNKDLVILVVFIKEWLIHHILVEDKKIGVFLEIEHSDKE